LEQDISYFFVTDGGLTVQALGYWRKGGLAEDQTSYKGQPGALKLPHTQGARKGATIWCIVSSLTLFLTQEAASRYLNP